MRVDAAVGGVRRVGPDTAHDLVAGKYAAWGGEQQREQQVFVTRQFKGLAVEDDAQGFWVMLPDGVCRCSVAARAGLAAQDGAHAGGDFAWRKGLGDVVVGTEFEAKNAVDFFAASGEEDHRNVPSFGVAAQLLEHFEARGVGQADVEDDQVERRLPVRRQGFPAQQHVPDGEAFAGQRVDQRVGNGLFVFNEKDVLREHGGRQ